ncbi:fumarate/nitrate reduction transcriptional regulator Fnr [Pseudoalteromonas denitrificans]|uniref:CRP/FNR family transcriptional regulator, anaerobic regulatory protein n=1 Tax=Pseudoalteromonas denitrificans DSM 6059 TaxID=1123010 RepID=A0A1I1G7M5_9GAMM|nr:fumarate/nitrate reduction transcriptional regulator Fnr [Pseudoalteromonas denitrificans]SFC07719.1 CRP/FNR family transcriptional regulator, anaerobic regulatory protein [Pseudoalteromonas denitrificans DSM 6059]
MNFKNITKIRSNFQISCNNCNISQLCLPVMFNEDEMGRLDDIIGRKKPYHKGDFLYKAGSKVESIFAIRSGSFKSYIITDEGEEQITNFHLAGDLLGFDSLADMKHKSYSQAMETGMICEIPLDTLDTLSNKIPHLRRQVLRIMSKEINEGQKMLLQLNKNTAEQRLAIYISNLSKRFGQRGFSDKDIILTMTRGEIGNYLGLTVETVCRLLSKLQKENIIQTKGKFITILNFEMLNNITLKIPALVSNIQVVGFND